MDFYRTGIRRRHVLTHERLDDLAILSARRALEDARTEGKNVDLILCATMRGDTFTPSLACTVAEAIGSHAPAFDLNAACVGVLYAMEIADSFIGTGKAETVLIVSAEAMSKLVDWSDRSTCVLFGDGSGAMVVKKGEGRLAGVLTSDPDSHVIRMPNIEGLNSPYNQIGQEKLAMYMDGERCTSSRSMRWGTVSKRCAPAQTFRPRISIGIFPIRRTFASSTRA